METRLSIRVRGRVQGVGFRPFVWTLARRFGLRGAVLNDGQGVLIEAAGPDMDGFVHALRAEAPPLARVDAIETAPTGPIEGEGFSIAQSDASGAETGVAPDAALCADCAAEIDGDGRRAGYAFTNCTNCGPRFTILERLPYDRANTTMAGFALCAPCRAEYDNPADRRFHAQPVACPDCGPRLSLSPPAAEPLAAAAARLRAGQIVALKGLGGYHLACDATDAAAVQRLRDRKARPAKPLALMAPRALIAGLASPDPAAMARLADPAAPILLLPRRAGDGLPDALAPGMAELGWMLPYTPLHHLLLRAVDRPLVMTSANLSGEPQVIDDAEAHSRLSGIADAILSHDRPIARRLDDSVERLGPAGPVVLRRARGLAPATLPLPEGFTDAPPVTAYGAQMKSALCLARRGEALLSHHLGDLDDALTWEEFLKADADYAALFAHAPAAVACDAHPGYRASQHAAGLGLPLIAVQHHHAHLASCLAEHRWPLEGGPVAGIVLDGLGLGADGTVWGGEVLLGDYRGFTRAAHLAPAPLPGGDAAAREPWRNALVRLDAAGQGALADRLFGARPIGTLRRAVASGVNAPLSSSAGRLFDAVAACLGLCPDGQSYEGEAAMRLEALARPFAADAGAGLPFAVADGVLDPAPGFDALAGALARGDPPGLIAARFHRGLARAFAAPAADLVARGEARAVALTGGCYQNPLLLRETVSALGDVPVLLHGEVPANDGGLALGQAVVAMAQLASG